MYNETSYTAKPSNKVAKYVLLGLSGSALIFVIAARISEKLSGLIWLGAFAFIVSALFIYTRYLGVEYCYQITNAGVPSLVVSQITGNRSRTMARIDLDSITELRYMTRDEYRAHKCDSAVVKYNYFPTMMPSHLYLISMRSEHERADIFIEADESFASALNASR